MTIDNMTKEWLKVWKLTKSRLTEDPAQLNVTIEQNEDTVEATLAESRRRISDLIGSKPGTLGRVIGLEKRQYNEQARLPKKLGQTNAE